MDILTRMKEPKMDESYWATTKYESDQIKIKQMKEYEINGRIKNLCKKR